MASQNTNIPGQYAPSASYELPPYTETLQHAPKDNTVAPGAGGTIEVVNQQGEDLLAAIQDNVTRHDSKRPIHRAEPKTNAPILEEPSLNVNPQTSFKSLIPLFLLGDLIAPAMALKTTIQGSIEDREFARSGAQISDDMSFEDIERSSSDPSLSAPPILQNRDKASTSYAAIINSKIISRGGESRQEAMSSEASDQELSPKELLNKVLTMGSPLSEETLNTHKKLQSNDPKVIFKAISEMVNWGAISPNQVETVKKLLNTLSEKISQGNTLGGTTGLKSSSDPLIMITLSLMLQDEVKDSDGDTKNSVEGALADISEKIYRTNLELNSYAEAPSKEFIGLNGDDPQQAQAVLNQLLSNLPGSNKLTSSDREKLSLALAKILTEKNSDGALTELRSNDPKVIEKLLEETIPYLASTGIPQATLIVILPQMATSISEINNEQLDKQLRSTDPDIVFDALMHKTAMASKDPLPMNKETKHIVVDYLKAFSAALAFLSQVRAKICELEGRLTQDQSQSRMASVSEQLQIANKVYTKSIEKINTQYVQGLKDIYKAQVLKILMPIICIVLAIVAVVVIVVSLIAAIPTGGASAITGAIAAKLIFLTMAAVIAVALVVAAVADAICTWTIGKGMWDSFFDAVSPGMPPAARAGIQIAVNLAILILLSVLTLGTCAVVGVVRFGASLASVGSTLAALGGGLFTTSAGLQVVSMFAQAIISSNILFYAVQAIAKAAKKSDEEAATIAMWVSFGLGIGVTAVFAAGSILKSVGTTIQQSGGLLSAMKSTLNTVKEGLNNIKEFFNGIGPFLKNLPGQIYEKYMEFKTFLSLLKAGDTMTTRIVKDAALAIGEKIKNLLLAPARAVGKKWEEFKTALFEGIGTGTKVGESSGKVALQDYQQILKMITNLKNYITGSKNAAELCITALEVLQKVLEAIASGVKISTSLQKAESLKQMGTIAEDLASLEALLETAKSQSKGIYDKVLDGIVQSSKEMKEQMDALLNLFASMVESAQRSSEKFYSAGR